MTKTKNTPGRKQFDGKDEKLVLQKLEEAFALGTSDEEACLYADISLSALYEYQKKSSQFLERKHLLKLNPVLKARQTVVRALETNADLALKFLERRRREEFSTGARIQISEEPYVLTDQEKEKLDRILGTNRDS